MTVAGRSYTVITKTTFTKLDGNFNVTCMTFPKKKTDWFIINHQIYYPFQYLSVSWNLHNNYHLRGSEAMWNKKCYNILVGLMDVCRKGIEQCAIGSYLTRTKCFQLPIFVLPLASSAFKKDVHCWCVFTTNFQGVGLPIEVSFIQ